MNPKAVQDLLDARARGRGDSPAPAVERLNVSGRLSGRERIAALLDPGSGVEFSALAGRAADGSWVPTEGGVDFTGTIDAQPVVVSASDFAQRGGGYGGGRIGRLCSLASENRWPVVLWAEGGGSKAVVPDGGLKGFKSLGGLNGLPVGVFEGLAELGGWVPTIAVVPGPSFAGHATMAAFCDVIVGVRGASLGMGGPPMVEAAFGLKLKPHELAPVEMHETTGGLDLLVDDEAAAVAVVRRYVGFWNDHPSGEASPAAANLRDAVPDEGPYDMHAVIEGVVDRDSFLELRPNWTPWFITGLARMGGRTVGVLANQPASANGGAIDVNAANKIARFVQLCDSYGWPMLSLIDTPGFAAGIGPEAAAPGMTRHHARAIRAQHHRTAPLASVQIRQARGLAFAAMAGTGNTHATPFLRLGWPGVELGVEDRYTQGFDDIVDPLETRARIIGVLRLTKRVIPAKHRTQPRDAW